MPFRIAFSSLMRPRRDIRFALPTEKPSRFEIMDMCASHLVGQLPRGKSSASESERLKRLHLRSQSTERSRLPGGMAISSNSEKSVTDGRRKQSPKSQE